MLHLSIIVSALDIMRIGVMSDQTFCNLSVFYLFTNETLNIKVDVALIK